MLELHLTTFFDKNYAARGIAMMRSLETHFDGKVYWYVLALDSESRNVLVQQERVNLHIITVEEVDPQLAVLKKLRSYKEFCWSVTPFLMNFMVNRIQNQGTLFGYIDADCYFFGDLRKELERISDNFSVAIHGHHFSSKRIGWEKTVGKFNVGLVLARKSFEALTCFAKWRTQVLESASVQAREGVFGDQAYLNSWLEDYPNAQEMKSTGIGAAPWNLDHLDLRFDSRSEILVVDENPLIFYHFHGLSAIKIGKNFLIVRCSIGYNISRRVKRDIYVKYISELLFLSEFYGLEITQRSRVLLSRKELLRLSFRSHVILDNPMVILI